MYRTCLWAGVFWVLGEGQESNFQLLRRQMTREVSKLSLPGCGPVSHCMSPRKMPLKQEKGTQWNLRLDLFSQQAFSEHLLYVWGCRRSCKDWRQIPGDPVP